MKATAVFRVYQCSKYDGTCWWAELDDILDADGESDPNHPLWLVADEEGLQDDEFMLNTDNPCVYGEPDSEHEVFGHVVGSDEFMNAEEYGKYENGTTNYEVRFFKLELEVDDEGRPVPNGELVLVKGELDEEHRATRLVAYFLGTPSQEGLLAALQSKEPNAAYAELKPSQVQDAVADRAGLQRWLLN